MVTNATLNSISLEQGVIKAVKAVRTENPGMGYREARTIVDAALTDETKATLQARRDERKDLERRAIRCGLGFNFYANASTDDLRSRVVELEARKQSGGNNG